jgi:hypothetical protein
MTNDQTIADRSLTKNSGLRSHPFSTICLKKFSWGTHSDPLTLKIRGGGRIPADLFRMCQHIIVTDVKKSSRSEQLRDR